MPPLFWDGLGFGLGGGNQDLGKLMRRSPMSLVFTRTSWTSDSSGHDQRRERSNGTAKEDFDEFERLRAETLRHAVERFVRRFQMGHRPRRLHR